MTTIAELKAENERLHDEIEFWMGEDGPEFCALRKVWRGLADIPKAERTPEQTACLRKIASEIRYRSDAELQGKRADKAEAECAWLKVKLAEAEKKLKEQEDAK